MHDHCADCTSCVTVNLHDTHSMSPVMYGAFFEEINHAGEGGLHVEMLRDWSFEGRAHLTQHPELGRDSANHMEPRPVDASVPLPYKRKTTLQSLSMDPETVASAKLRDMEAWRVVPDNIQATLEEVDAALAVTPGALGAGGPANDVGAAALAAAYAAAAGNTATPPRALHALCLHPRDGEVAQVVNSGHTLEGFTLHPATDYTLRMRVKGGPDTLQAAITSPAGDKVYTRLSLERPVGGDAQAWHTLAGTISTKEGGAHLRLVIRAKGPEQLCLDWVSLTPAAAWGTDGRLDPFHPGLVAKLRELAPQHLRFPGGAYVEGTTLATAYRWKWGVGPRELRPGHPDANWGYWSSGGLGLHEWLDLAEALGSEPIWVLNVGISQSESVAPQDLAPWVQDGLDSLEYVLGPPDSKWGAVRAAAGRPEPWTLRWLTLGNEECMRPWYVAHYRVFAAAVRARYPTMQLIANCDLTGAPGSEGNNTAFSMWEFHSYRSPTDTWTLRDAVDAYQGPPVGVTEFAAMSGAEVALNAVAEAGLMAALERNCHKVHMVAFAPLLAHDALRSWRPDLIVFNEAGQVIGIPSFTVQRMFRQYAGTVCGKVRLEVLPGIEGSATCANASCDSSEIKLVNFNNQAQTISLRIRRHARSLLAPLRLRSAPRVRSVAMSQLHVEHPETVTHAFGAKPAFVPRDTVLMVSENGDTLLSLPPYSVTFIHLTQHSVL